jgi:hypothetical protein
MMSNYAVRNMKTPKTLINDKIRQITPKCLRQVNATNELAESQTPCPYGNPYGADETRSRILGRRQVLVM